MIFCILFIVLVKTELRSRPVGFIIKHSCFVGMNFYSTLLNLLQESAFKKKNSLKETKVKLAEVNRNSASRKLC